MPATDYVAMKEEHAQFRKSEAVRKKKAGKKVEDDWEWEDVEPIHTYKSESGEDWLEIHVDQLADTEQRFKLGGGEHNGMLSVRFPTEVDCQHGHTAEKCKCHLPLYHIGQDETAFKQNAVGRGCWSINGS